MFARECRLSSGDRPKSSLISPWGKPRRAGRHRTTKKTQIPADGRQPLAAKEEEQSPRQVGTGKFAPVLSTKGFT